MEDDRIRTEQEGRVEGGKKSPPASYDSNQKVANRLFSLVDAISDLLVASGDLVSNHLELARLELREDISGLINRAVLVGAIVIMLFFGYSLLLVASVLLVGWAWGIPGMALATLVLALVHLGVTIPQAKRLITRMRKPAEFKRTRKELENTKQWMNKQTGSSSSKKQLPTKEPLESLSLKN